MCLRQPLNILKALPPDKGAVSGPEVASPGAGKAVSGLDVASPGVGEAVSGLEVASAGVEEAVSGLGTASPPPSSRFQVAKWPSAGVRYQFQVLKCSPTGFWTPFNPHAV